MYKCSCHAQINTTLEIWDFPLFTSAMKGHNKAALLCDTE